MSPSTHSTYKDGVTPESLAIHLNAEPNLPGAEDLNALAITGWIVALGLGLHPKELFRLAPKVLEELRAMDGITAEDASRHQQRYPVELCTPKPIYVWNAGVTLVEKAKNSSPKRAIAKQKSAPEVVGDMSVKSESHGDPTGKSAVALVTKVRASKEEVTKHAVTGVSENDEIGGVKLEEEEEDSEEDPEEAAKKTKRAKKAAKRVRKLARVLESVKPPVGKKEVESEDDGDDSDWSESRWSPSWASDHGEK
ncbi:hypothetical protein E4T47_01517 [Aureobasidium subglaciale]|nr:hypothetical protein E4T47_01517 [Aureobasidium subglaciale]